MSVLNEHLAALQRQIDQIRRELDAIQSREQASVPRNNYTATTAPGTGDDADDGYSVGSEWIYNGTVYKCVNAAPGAATWVTLS